MDKWEHRDSGDAEDGLAGTGSEVFRESRDLRATGDFEGCQGCPATRDIEVYKA